MPESATDVLDEYAKHIERLQWSAMLVDRDARLRWVSPELKRFIGEDDDEALRVGAHLVEAWTSDVWMRTATPESQMELFAQLGPFLITELANQGHDPLEMIPPTFHPLIEGIEPAEVPSVWSGSFLYVDPKQPELPTYRVNMCFVRLREDDGGAAGWLILFYMDVRPNLVSLLVRGDQEMYERMAKLIEPAPRQAAILFCDLHESGRLSRRVSSITYFRLVRRLWTAMDAVVAEECGIVGKHAGDGASAYFLVEDLGSPSAAAAVAVRAARRIHAIGHEVFGDVVDSSCQMKIGLHWGGSLYMGQLVPGGRLDVTALGDEVNEAARIQECAASNETLISKELVEQLSPDDAAALGIDLEKLSYRVVSDLPGASEKVLRDAGGIAVTAV